MIGALEDSIELVWEGNSLSSGLSETQDNCFASGKSVSGKAAAQVRSYELELSHGRWKDRRTALETSVGIRGEWRDRRSDLRYFLEVRPTGLNSGLVVGYRGKDLRMNLGRKWCRLLVGEGWRLRWTCDLREKRNL